MDINEIHKNKKCIFCKRSYPEVILNIEGFLHHKEKPRCLDLKQCKRYIKKQKS